MTKKAWNRKTMEDEIRATFGLKANAEVSAIGAQVARILDDIFGIHNVWYWKSSRKIDWGAPDRITMLYSQGLDTFDLDRLTQLVVRCHDAAIRLSIDPAMRFLRLSFWQRQRAGGITERHPTIEEAVTSIRACNYYGEEKEEA